MIAGCVCGPSGGQTGAAGGAGAPGFSRSSSRSRGLCSPAIAASTCGKSACGQACSNFCGRARGAKGPNDFSSGLPSNAGASGDGINRSYSPLGLTSGVDAEEAGAFDLELQARRYCNLALVKMALLGLIVGVILGAPFVYVALREESVVRPVPSSPSPGASQPQQEVSLFPQGEAPSADRKPQTVDLTMSTAEARRHARDEFLHAPHRRQARVPAAGVS